jgi:hypothetical protein
VNKSGNRIEFRTLRDSPPNTLDLILSVELYNNPLRLRTGFPKFYNIEMAVLPLSAKLHNHVEVLIRFNSEDVEDVDNDNDADNDADDCDGVIPAGTLLFYLDVSGTGTIALDGYILVSYPYFDEDWDEWTHEYDIYDFFAEFDLGGVSLPVCGDCSHCNSRRLPRTGYVLGNNSIGIMDALEILKYLVNMDNAIDVCDYSRFAAQIVACALSDEDPTIMDVLEILKHLVSMDGVLKNL